MFKCFDEKVETAIKARFNNILCSCLFPWIKLPPQVPSGLFASIKCWVANMMLMTEVSKVKFFILPPSFKDLTKFAHDVKGDHQNRVYEDWKNHHQISHIHV